MGLTLISGPPNSGRAQAILAALETAAGQDPVLVVPTRDHVVRFERDLCRGRESAMLGVVVTTFDSLFATVATAAGERTPPPLSRAQRRQLIRRAAASCAFRDLAATARTRGFVPAVERLLGELQAAGVSPTALESAVSGRIGGELAAVYARYRELCRELGVVDRHDLAAAAISGLRATPESWAARPVFAYGFDDLTPEQTALVGALADAAEVTVAVTFADRAALAARSRLLAELRDDLGGRVELDLPADSTHTGSDVLRHLDRHLFEPGAPRIAPDPGLELLDAAGVSAEAEQIGGRIARLLADGVAPDEVAIVLRSPDAEGPVFGRTLRSLGIPVATEARVPLSRTGVGQALAALVRACFGAREATDVLAFLRARADGRPESVDWLERAVLRGRLRSASDALERWSESNRRAPWEIEAVTSADGNAERLLVLGRVAVSIGERPLRGLAGIPHGSETLELRAASAVRGLCEELASLGEHAPELGEAIAALDELTVPLWTGPVEGRVRIVDPYRVRAGRASHLFVASLQDGAFPGAGTQDSLLADEEREALGLPARRAPLEEERYLFHACISRPTTCLYLSSRSYDEDGQALVVSPFIDDVRELLTEDAGPLLGRRGLDAVAFSASDAPNQTELRRALAAMPAADATRWVSTASLPEAITGEALRAVDAARMRARVLPGPLRSERVISELSERRLYGASTLEEYIGCPYRWFVSHELAPESLRPKPDPLTQGGIIHEVFERLYAERPAGDPLPRPKSLDAWRSRARELVVEIARENEIDPGRSTRETVTVARMLALIDHFIARQAETESPLSPDPTLLEASFGTDGSDQPALEIGDFELRGLIDRIDISTGPRRAALIQDYKLGRKVATGNTLEREGKLQLQLYAIAARELWGLELIGAVYHPLGGRGGRESRSRGLLAASEREGLLAGVEYVNTDFAEDEELEAALDSASEKASEVVEAMRSGVVARRPLGGTCPAYCTFQPICRRERAASLEPDVDAERAR